MTERTFISVILPLKLDWEPCYYAMEAVEVGDRVRVAFAGKSYTGVIHKTGIEPEIAPERIKPIISIESDIGKVSCEELELWSQVAHYYLCTIGEVYRAAYPVGNINIANARAAARNKILRKREKIVSAIDARILRLNERLEKKRMQAQAAKDGTKAKSSAMMAADRICEEIRSATESKAAVLLSDDTRNNMPMPLIETDIILSDYQKTALDEIQNGFKDGMPVLLHGVTGSGKTEIYMKLAIDAISRGMNVLYLVPEIALSHQLEDRMHEHFGGRLLVFHSGESASSRYSCAEKIRNTSPENGGYIVLSTRSGLFLPHHDLGLIIVDEEHDASYKQDSPAPRYNGRDTALMLSRIHGCPIVLGSATPSLEELYNTTTGRHLAVRLEQKYHSSEDVGVEIIDTKAERAKHGMIGNFSRKLIDRVRQTLANGGQVLILRSRRAWATSLQCSRCGEIQKCGHCNVSLSYHKAFSTSVCHYCGHKEQYTGMCISCGGPLVPLGSGTQKIEEEAAALFPDARIARLDSDIAQKKSEETRIIRAFAKGEIDILIGTQIITKGFDFANLNLVAVISADAMLGAQDFRADEKAIQVFEQFRGRCGRRAQRGTLVIQTAQPEHPVYMNFFDTDRGNSSRRLLMERKDFAFPPYTRIVELTIRDISEERAENMSAKLAGVLRGFDLTGPYSPVIDKISDHHIRKIRISFNKNRYLFENKDRLKRLVMAFEKDNHYDGSVIIDVDPS